MWSSTSPVHWKSLKSGLKTYHDVPNNILKELFFLQKSYGNTTRLKILNTIKKNSVPYFRGILVLGQTRAQRQLPSQLLLTHIKHVPNFLMFFFFTPALCLLPIFFNPLFFLHFFMVFLPLKSSKYFVYKQLIFKVIVTIIIIIMITQSFFSIALFFNFFFPLFFAPLFFPYFFSLFDDFFFTPTFFPTFFTALFFLYKQG